MAAASLYDKLETGTYTHNGKRRKIDGDTSKLFFAEGITKQEKRLLMDFRFRTRSVPGTQEIRSEIGRIGFWASIRYGHGIFMTISPGERHNYLALRLSRHRQRDPFVAPQAGAESPEAEEARAREERKWIGPDAHLDAAAVHYPIVPVKGRLVGVGLGLGVGLGKG